MNTLIYTDPKFPRKPYPIPDQNALSAHPFSDKKGAKTLPDGKAHTYMAYIREYSPGEVTRLGGVTFLFISSLILFDHVYMIGGVTRHMLHHPSGVPHLHVNRP